jgi:murein hydrolase activator
MQPRRNIHSYPDTARRGQLDSVRIPLSIALLSAGFAGMSLLPASAQVAGTAAQATAASPDAIKQREQELEATRAQQKSAADAQTKLQAEIAARTAASSISN